MKEEICKVDENSHVFGLLVEMAYESHTLRYIKPLNKKDFIAACIRSYDGNVVKAMIHAINNLNPDYCFSLDEIDLTKYGL